MAALVRYNQDSASSMTLNASNKLLQNFNKFIQWNFLLPAACMLACMLAHPTTRLHVTSSQDVPFCSMYNARIMDLPLSSFKYYFFLQTAQGVDSR